MVNVSSKSVHDGAGRSGVFLAIDANIELAEEDGVFDVYGYLKKMRQSRRGLIETIDQYKFVYDTLEEFVTCGYSSFPVSELSQRLKEKAVKGPDKLNDYQREFNQICRQVPKFTIGDCAGGHRADNRHKNRDVMIVPPDNFRPYLTSFQGTSATDLHQRRVCRPEHKNKKKEEHKTKKKEEHKNKKKEGHRKKKKKKKKKKEHMIKEERVFKKEHKNQEEHVYKKKEHKNQEEHVYKKKEHKIQEHVYKKKEHKIQEHVYKKKEHKNQEGHEYKKKEHTNKEEKHKIKRVNEGEQAGMSLELSSTGTPHRLS
ncbi:Receptor-type tyrosine-protein phosphatase U [Amphibalanus amphitrite]|uniref:Receptor-type tyrosine-protein phosphatase U n=1 Tax=Amphibalanus amphitrite TaxID=1232801 RepID=A0A6A4VTS4_AMPAM|nr:Receptor-type tyrosine-protein phosphatase U [Amphibalanus amphitrite]